VAPVLVAFVYGVAIAALSLDVPEWLGAALAVPAVLWFPGLGWATRLGPDRLTRGLDAFWISALLAIPSVIVARRLAFPGLTVLGVSAAWWALGCAVASRRPAGTRGTGAAILGVIAVLGWSWTQRPHLLRPLERHWWFPAAEEDLVDGGTSPAPGLGWARVVPGPWAASGATVLEPSSGTPWLAGPARGPFVVAVSAPVGTRVAVGGELATVEASPTEREDEGAVRRYRERGVVAFRVHDDLDPGERLDLVLPLHPADRVYVIPTPAALWDLHGAGELRFTHYYQLLNMVEQLDWATELGNSRWVTDVQPPLWSWILAAPLAVTGGGLPTTNLLFVGTLLLTLLAAVRFVAAWSERPPPLAWLLPGAATVACGKLVLEPGSTDLPDLLYATAAVHALASLGSGVRFATFGLAAQLLRYPATGLLAAGALLAGRPGRALGLTVVVAAAAAVFGVFGVATGALQGWLDTVAFETGPEHWHGDTSVATLLPRVAPFYLSWLIYAGGTPLLAALRWPVGTRVALGSALAYSLLLCTIDHSPTHYFLPLVLLSSLSLATTAGDARHPLVRHGLPALGLLGLSIFVLRGDIRG
jgi:hypothetical protein